MVVHPSVLVLQNSGPDTVGSVVSVLDAQTVSQGEGGEVKTGRGRETGRYREGEGQGGRDREGEGGGKRQGGGGRGRERQGGGGRGRERQGGGGRGRESQGGGGETGRDREGQGGRDREVQGGGGRDREVQGGGGRDREGQGGTDGGVALADFFQSNNELANRPPSSGGCEWSFASSCSSPVVV